MSSLRDSRPIFSIGITAYNRNEFLSEALRTLLAQPVQNIEIIIGNDYVPKPLILEELGINDPRVKVFNHPSNLGECGNLNWLWGQCKGTYITCMADDDLIHPDYLKNALAAFENGDSPSCLFTSYHEGPAYPASFKPKDYAPQVWSGREFMRRYYSREIRAHLVYGVYRRGTFQGERALHLKSYAGTSQYIDPQLVFLVSKMDRVCYLDSEQMFFRTHPGSPSYSSTDVERVLNAQKPVFQDAVQAFRASEVAEDFAQNLENFIIWRTEDVLAVMARARRISIEQLQAHLGHIRIYTRLLGLGQIRTWARVAMLGARVFLRALLKRKK